MGTLVVGALYGSEPEEISQEERREYTDEGASKAAERHRNEIINTFCPALAVILVLVIIFQISDLEDGRGYGYAVPGPPGPMPPPMSVNYRCPECKHHRQYINKQMRWYCEYCNKYDDADLASYHNALGVMTMHSLQKAPRQKTPLSLLSAKKRRSRINTHNSSET